MEETDQVTEPVQPEESEGQGGGGPSDAPYAEYLESVPEELRGQVEPAFKKWDSDVGRKFQEHAEYRRGWEETGVTPDQVSELVQFAQLFQDPQQAQQWWESYAQQAGITPQEAQRQAQEPDFNYQEPGIEDVLKQHLSPLEQKLEAFSQWQQQQEYQSRLVEAERHVSSQIEELKAKHPQEFNEEAIEKLVAQYIESDPQNAVKRAFSDWQAIRSQIEKDTLQAKVNAPPGAESGGVPDGAPEEIKTLADADRIARERLRQARQA